MTQYIRNPFAGRSVEDLNFYIQTELLKIEQLFAEPVFDSIRLTIRYVEPDSPEEGHIYYADGTEWNPGSGKGPYVYVGDEWLPMFSLVGHKVTPAKLRIIGIAPTFTNTTQRALPQAKNLNLSTFAPLLRTTFVKELPGSGVLNLTSIAPAVTVA